MILTAALVLSIALNGALFLLLYGCFRQHAAMLQEVAQAKALVEIAIAEVERRQPAKDRDFISIN